jgi:hypothetical protein
VSSICCESLEFCKGSFQAAEETIEDPRHVAQFVFLILDLEAFAQVPLGDAFGSDCHGIEGTECLSSDPISRKSRNDQSKRHTQQEQDQELRHPALKRLKAISKSYQKQVSIDWMHMTDERHPRTVREFRGPFIERIRSFIPEWRPIQRHTFERSAAIENLSRYILNLHQPID